MNIHKWRVGLEARIAKCRFINTREQFSYVGLRKGDT